jgi:hypothetical protein
MAKYSHYQYSAKEKNAGSLRRKLFYFILLMLLLISMFAIYGYQPLVNTLHKAIDSMLGKSADANTLEAKNEPPPVHFEFYTALAKAEMAPLPEPPQAITSHDELEKEMSAVVNHKRNEE